MKLNTIICAAAVCGCVSFATVADEPAKTETTEPSKAELAEEEQGEEEEDSLVSAVCDNVKVKAYIAYADYWFDRKLRDGARAYNGAWGHGDKYANSWNIYGGVGVALSF